jgi:hypothetical protein
MHRLIRILVFAQNEVNALDAARRIVHDKLVGLFPESGAPFDSAVDFTDCAADSGGLTAEMMVGSRLGLIVKFGKDRWGPIPPVLQVSTARFPIDDPRGMEQVKAAFEQIRKEFDRNMESIRYHIANYTNDELFSEVEGKGEVEIDGEKLLDCPGGFQYCCEYVSDRPEEGYLYDFKGYCITRLYHLQRIITDSDENPFFVDESDGQNPEWHKHMWNQPLWIVPFDVHY